MSQSTPQQRGMTLTEHLEELRKRLVRCMIGIAVGFGICYGYSQELFAILMRPLVKSLPAGSHLIFTSPAEAFFTYLKVGVVAGIFVSSPFLFYQFWQFLAPGLYPEERRFIIPIALASGIFFTLGALFGYFVVFPFGFEYFMSYASDVILPMPSVKESFSFSISLLFAFGVIFELPLVIFFLARFGLVTSTWLRKQRRYAILVIFIVAAILTPPDPFTQSLMAVPMCILYEIGIWVAHFFGKKRPGTDNKAKENAGDNKAEGSA